MVHDKLLVDALHDGLRVWVCFEEHAGAAAATPAIASGAGGSATTALHPWVCFADAVGQVMSRPVRASRSSADAVTPQLGWSSSVLLDFVISDETCFLEYLLRLLKLGRSAGWTCTVRVLDSDSGAALHARACTLLQLLLTLPRWCSAAPARGSRDRLRLAARLPWPAARHYSAAAQQGSVSIQPCPASAPHGPRAAASAMNASAMNAFAMKGTRVVQSLSHHNAMAPAVTMQHSDGLPHTTVKVPARTARVSRTCWRDSALHPHRPAPHPRSCNCGRARQALHRRNYCIPSAQTPRRT